MRPLKAEHHVPRRYEVRHVTAYTYTDDVTSSYGRACLRPRDTDDQLILGNDIRIDPQPETLIESTDMFGNYSHYFEVHTRHRALTVSKTTVVDVHRPEPDLVGLDRYRVADAATLRGEDDPTLRAAYLLPSPLVTIGGPVEEYGRVALDADAPLGTALSNLVTAINTDFAYRKGATTVRTSLPELLQIGAGVCQDFAHLAIGCLRSFGLPARYVSGYLETMPPPGKPKLVGSDATHAWVSVRLPGGKWLDLDPTNNCVADSRYVITGWGRDYRDVSPLRGIIFSEGGTSSLNVSVDVARLDD